MQNHSQAANVVTFAQKQMQSSSACMTKRSESEKKQKAILSIKQFAELNKRFESIWEEKWTIKVSQHGESLITEWREELALFDDNILQEAATRARGRFTWPPSIAEFSDICREIKSGIKIPIMPRANKCGSSDMTHQEWMTWFKIRFGAKPSV